MEREQGQFVLEIVMPTVGPGWTVEHSWAVATMLRELAGRIEGHPHFGIGHSQPVGLTWDGREFYGQFTIREIEPAPAVDLSKPCWDIAERHLTPEL